jgi:hypothetical protein
LIAARILAVTAALLLVGAFALATLLPPSLSLGQFMASIDHPTLLAVQDFVRTRISEWTWREIAVPLLVRPCWLIPLSLGLVTGGLALTLSSQRGAPRSHRRRS